MNKLNSFCVVATEHKRVLFWSKPQDLDTAIELYSEKMIQLLNEPENTAIFDWYSNERFEKKLIECKGDSAFIQYLMSSVHVDNKKGGIILKLTHSSQT